MDNGVLIWNRVWVWAFIIMGCLSFWSGILMVWLGAGNWETLVVWSFVFPLFSAGMVWYLISTDEN